MIWYYCRIHQRKEVKCLNVLLQKLKEVLFAVLPITLIVLILNFTIAPMETHLVLRFIIGAFSIIIGLGIFLFGIDIGISPIGKHMGSKLIKTNILWLVIVITFILGFFVVVAEPNLHILANQLNKVSSGVISSFGIVAVVSLGMGLMMSLGVVRIVKNIPLKMVLIVVYGIMFLLVPFTTAEFLAISFDSAASATGSLVVPFILTFAIGVSSLKKDSKASEEDSFGLIGLTGSGAILGVLIMSVINNPGDIPEISEVSSTTSSVFEPFITSFPQIALNSLIALLPIAIIFFIFQIFSLKLSKRFFKKICKGLAYTFIGLTLFMVGVDAGFMEVGSLLGNILAAFDNKLIVLLVGFILGLVTILAEPAVYVLTEQIEEVTSGYVKRRVVLFALSIGVGTAVALSILRMIVPGIQLWHYLVPGYLMFVAFSFFIPDLFVGIAYDSGSVASGPMSATFILAFAKGVAEKLENANVLIDGFGVIAMIALTPLIALQVLGLIFKLKTRKGGFDENGKLS